MEVPQPCGTIRRGTQWVAPRFAASIARSNPVSGACCIIDAIRDSDRSGKREGPAEQNSEDCAEPRISGKV